MSLLDNNKIELIFGLLILAYNIYSRIKGAHNFNLIIGDNKNNIKDANKVGFLYKVKFLFYTFTSCVSCVNFMLQIFSVPAYRIMSKIF